MPTKRTKEDIEADLSEIEGEIMGYEDAISELEAEADDLRNQLENL